MEAELSQMRGSSVFISLIQEMNSKRFIFFEFVTESEPLVSRLTVFDKIVTTNPVWCLWCCAVLNFQL